ncbi:hypothetical protein ACWFRB_09335 [Rhodococcus sp. NPDC055112]
MPDGTNSLTIDVHRWLPGEPIPYDTMRAILGLPDVKREVERERARREAAAALKQLSAVTHSFAAVFVELSRAAATAGEQIRDVFLPQLTHDPREAK